MNRKGRASVLPLLFGVSGGCALVYEVVWTRWLALVAGNFATATTAVVAVFMGGMAAGTFAGARGSVRWTARDALRGYGWCEAGVAVAGMGSLVFWSPQSSLMGFLGRLADPPAARGLLCALPLLIPTVLLGATFPFAVRALDRGPGPAGLGWLYAVNTLGGALGVLAAAFWLIPSAGLRGSVGCAVGLNTGCAAIALWLAGRADDGGDAGEIRRGPATDRIPWQVLSVAAVTGFLALGMELALTRQFILTVTGGSVYGFASVLASFLGGIALGAAMLRQTPPADAPGAWARCGAALLAVWACAMSTPYWDRVPVLLLPVWLKPMSFAARWAVDGVVVTALTLVTTTAFGYALPALTAASGSAPADAVGPVFAANTAGAVAGTLVTGFWLLPDTGLHATFLWLGTGALAVAGASFFLTSGTGWRWRWLALGGLAATPLLLPAPDAIIMNLGIWNRPVLFNPAAAGSFSRMFDRGAARGTIVYEKDGYTGRIAVWRLERPGSPPLLSFIVNGKPDGSNGPSDMFTQVGSVHLAVLAHPSPRRALVIGLGTGISAGSLALHPEIESLEIAENEPAQVEVARLFAGENGHVLEQPRVHLVLDDARRMLARGGPPYDVIFSEPSNLFVSGMVSLYTREFYRLARARLARGGVFLQWLHYYQMRPEDVRGAMRTFCSVFPEATFWINPFGDSFLLARLGGVAVDVDDWNRRLSRPALTADLARLRMGRPFEMLGFFLWGPADLARFAGDAPICTDDRPYLEFTTPRNRFVGDSTVPRIAMQQFGPLEPMPVLWESAGLRRRLAALFAARHSDARAAAERARALELSR